MSKKNEQREQERKEHEEMQDLLRQQIARIDNLLEDASLTVNERERLINERDNLGMDFVMSEICGP